MKSFLLLSFAILLSACGPSAPEAVQIATSLATAENSDRFTVTQVSRFYDKDAYNQMRSIYIIHDRVTGKEFVGVTGIGVSQVATHTETTTSLDGDGNTTTDTKTVEHEE